MTDPASIFTPEVSAEEKRRAKYRAWRARNIESIRAKEREYARKNYARKREIAKAWIAARPEKEAEYGKRYRQTHKERHAQRNKEWAQSNPEKSRAKSKRWKDKNRERTREYSKKYALENREQRRETMRRWRSDPGVKITEAMRIRLKFALRRQCAKIPPRSTLHIGCTIEFLVEWLERQFTKGMTWKNYGEWHVDHIVPCAAFDHTDNDQILKCWHYTNLRPLWATENRRKCAKIITSQPELPIPLFTHGRN